MTLYLKYRPKDFKTVVDQDHVVITLQNALKRDAVSHAYLFGGPRGTGKTSLARILAKAINCLELQEGEPCNQCAVCRDISQGRLIDLIEIDAASNRGIDEIRELREKIQFAPTHAKAKVYIIDEVHMLTKEAFNALLKTLEEPPEHAYFILATTEPHKIPETILSRCQQFSFKRIDHESIQRQLKKIADFEGIQADPEALSLMAKMASGSLRDAIGLMEQMTINGKIEGEAVAQNLGLSGPLLVDSFFQALSAREAAKALEIINQLNQQGKNLHQFMGEVLSFLREQMLINIDHQEILAFLMELTETFSQAKREIHHSLIPQLPVEMAIIKICRLSETKEVQNKKTTTPKQKREEKAEKDRSQGAEVTSEKIELNLALIKTKWPQVLETIKTPFIRVSLLDGEPAHYEKGELRLVFKSGSFMEKVSNKVNQAEIQEAFLKTFQEKIKLKMELKKINLKPMEGPLTSKEPSVVEMAKEVFGV